MIVEKRGIPNSSITALFIGKDRVFEAENFTGQYEKILTRFPELSALAFAEQVHGDRAISVPRPESRLYFPGEGDALYTREAGVALLIRTADCIPILFHSASDSLLGAVHAGWRGLKAQILSKAVAAAGKAEDLQFIVGPFISGKSYEVGADVAEQFAPAFNVAKADGKYLLDLRQILEAEFSDLGVTRENVEWHDDDTLVNHDWYSARRGDSRRNLAVIFSTTTN